MNVLGTARKSYPIVVEWKGVQIFCSERRSPHDSGTGIPIDLLAGSLRMLSDDCCADAQVRHVVRCLWHPRLLSDGSIASVAPRPELYPEMAVVEKGSASTVLDALEAEIPESLPPAARLVWSRAGFFHLVRERLGRAPYESAPPKMQRGRKSIPKSGEELSAYVRALLLSPGGEKNLVIAEGGLRAYYPNRPKILALTPDRLREILLSGDAAVMDAEIFSEEKDA